MPEQIAFPVLHVHLGSGAADAEPSLTALVAGLRRVEEVRQYAVVAGDASTPRLEAALPDGRTRPLAARGRGRLSLRPGLRALAAVGVALGDLVADPSGGRRAVQWPVPERWAVVHAHGAAALRAVWMAAAWRGSNARVLASPLPGDGSPPGGPWRKADLVAAPDRERRGALARRGVERRRLRILRPGDGEEALRLYRRLAADERRRAQRVDWGAPSSRPPAAGDGEESR